MNAELNNGERTAGAPYGSNNVWIKATAPSGTITQKSHTRDGGQRQKRGWDTTLKRERERMKEREDEGPNVSQIVGHFLRSRQRKVNFHQRQSC